jgi:hypothetical protein
MVDGAETGPKACEFDLHANCMRFSLFPLPLTALGEASCVSAQTTVNPPYTSLLISVGRSPQDKTTN